MTVPIPVSCAQRPVVGGLVAPWVNARMADGGVDFRSPHQRTYERAWREDRCQVCGGRLPPFVVLFGGPNQLRSLRFDEPPLCPPCAVYASAACPMVAGRLARYASGPRVAETRRGQVCSEPGCGCGGWVPSDPDSGGSEGDPAHAWFACWVGIRAWELTAHYVDTRCSDRACNQPHRRLLINGCRLTAPPTRIRLVSAPGRGRIWQRITYEQAIAL